MSYNIKTKNGIAFNLDDPHQKELYDHICKVPNVSSYLKRLVSMDLMGSWSTKPKTEEEIEQVAQVNDDMMLSLI